jgi:hypothetical protein
MRRVKEAISHQPGRSCRWIFVGEQQSAKKRSAGNSFEFLVACFDQESCLCYSVQEMFFVVRPRLAGKLQTRSCSRGRTSTKNSFS